MLRNFLRGDPLLRQFFDVFLFEEVPASDQRPDNLYLGDVERSDVLVALLGNEYGPSDHQGVSPTEREFDRATSTGKHRLVFLKGAGSSSRHPKMQALINKAQANLVRKGFDWELYT